jgi:hypothetical protein
MLSQVLPGIVDLEAGSYCMVFACIVAKTIFWQKRTYEVEQRPLRQRARLRSYRSFFALTLLSKLIFGEI